MAVVIKCHVLKSNGAVELRSSAAIQIFSGFVSRVDSVEQGPVGTLALGQFLILLLHLAKEREGPTQRYNQHHNGGQIHTEAINRNVNTEADKGGEHEFLSRVQYRPAQYLAAQRLVQLIGIVGQHLVSKMFARHGFEGLNGLQGIGEVGHQRCHKPGLFIARLAGDQHQEMGQADDHRARHNGN